MGFTKLEKDVLNISKLPDSVKGNAKELKATFDKAGEDIKKAHNDLIDELAEQNAASNIGAISEEGATTVQAELDKLNDRIKVDFTELEIDIDDELSLESGNAVKNKVIAKEIETVKGDLYASDRYNKAIPEYRKISSGVYTTDLFEGMSVGRTQVENKNVRVSGTTPSNVVYSLDKAFDGSTSTQYQGYITAGKDGNITFEFEHPVKINKMRTYITLNSTSYFSSIKIVGSKDGVTWTDLYNFDAVQTALTDIVLNNADFYKFYQIKFQVTTSSYSKVVEIKTTEWEGDIYEYVFDLDIPLEEYKNNKIIEIVPEVYSSPLEDAQEIEEEFDSNIIPEFWGNVATKNKYGIWEIITNITNGYKMFDGSTDSEALLDSTARTLTLQSRKDANNNRFYIKPKTITYDAYNIAAISFYGIKEDGSKVLIGTTSNSNSNVSGTINVETNEYYTGIYISGAKYNATSNSSSIIREVKITSGTIKYNTRKCNDKFINPYVDINKLGIKQLTGELKAGVQYSIIYNGVNFDQFCTTVSGEYTGNDAGTRKIYTPFKPSAVILFRKSDYSMYSYSSTSSHRYYYHHGGVGIERETGTDTEYIRLENDGFTVFNNKNDFDSDRYYNSTNIKDTVYVYIAFR